MALRILANINHEILRWARETSGLSLELAAKKIGISKPEKLRGFEQGEEQPSISQIRNASRVYKRPVAVFFLPTVPPLYDLPHDFRRMPGIDVAEPSSQLLFELRKARRRRNVAQELLENLESQPQNFTLRGTLNDNVDTLAGRIRDWLDVPMQQQRTWIGYYDAFNAWMSTLESKGVFVFQTADVPLSEMRGFSISNDIHPTIVLNGKDSPKARTFTLMHELTHLVLHQGGLCDPLQARSQTTSDDEFIEVFCNRVAGSILVPPAILNEFPEVARANINTRWQDDQIRVLADSFAVSREVVLLRLYYLQKVSQAFVDQKFAQYRREYAQLAAQSENEGYPPKYRLVIRDNGKKYTRLVLEALERERITLADVSDYLGVRLKHLDRISDAVQAG